jgi:hypothetical protein
MTSVAIARDPYGDFRTKAFSKNYNRSKNLGEYDANTLGSQGYSGDLIGKDEYGQDYNVGEIDLTPFDGRLKTARDKPNCRRQNVGCVRKHEVR